MRYEEFNRYPTCWGWGRRCYHLGWSRRCYHLNIQIVSLNYICNIVSNELINFGWFLLFCIYFAKKILFLHFGSSRKHLIFDAQVTEDPYSGHRRPLLMSQKTLTHVTENPYSCSYYWIIFSAHSFRYLKQRFAERFKKCFEFY